MTVPYTFASATSPLPLSELDSNFVALGNSTNSTYTANSVNAVSRTVQNKLSDFVSVLDFGADETGISDSALAFQQAANFSNFVYVPPGTYVLYSSISMTNGVNFVGAGRGAVTILPTGNFDVFAWSGSATGGGISNMLIDGLGMTGGNLISNIGQSRFLVQNMSLINGYNGIYIQDQTNTTINTVFINSLTGVYGVKNFGTNASSANVLNLSDVTIGWTTNSSSSSGIGFWFDSGVNTVDMKHCANQKGYRGIQITNTSNLNGRPLGVTSYNFQAENMYDSGLYIDGGTSHTSNHKFTELYCSSSVASVGVYISSTCYSCSIVGGNIRDNYKQGVVANGRYTTIVGSLIVGNCDAGGAAYPEIEIGGSVSPGIVIANNTIGAQVGMTLTTTSYGIIIDAGTTYYNIVGNYFFGSANGAYLDNANDANSTIFANSGVTATTPNMVLGPVKYRNSAAFTGNGSVATNLGSVGPTGSHTTVQKWLTIQDGTNSTLYIPCF